MGRMAKFEQIVRGMNYVSKNLVPLVSCVDVHLVGNIKYAILMFDWMCMCVQGGQRHIFWLLVFHFWSSRNHIWYNHDNISCSNLFYMSPLLIHVIMKLLLLLSLILKA